MSDDTSQDALLTGLDSAAEGAAYQVLARKYRPQRFEDLIGQEAMVRTLTNAFAAKRIAHAFMLTGVRGVGKTTTARLLARALNYETDKVREPSITLDPPGRHCAAIAASRHQDVLEMDAASRTGVDDIREIIDGTRYGAGEARFKIYIIDEIHMLSKNAFNALLKTLEEPPAHVKFIFATTEIRKVPVTVLSRCQRFDLRRVPSDQLLPHLASICAQEKADIAEDCLKLIVRAAEGSVRDALSLLDQAIVQGAGGAVSAAAVRDMLGLADRGRSFDILSFALTADAKAAAQELDAQIAVGADPLIVMRDLLDHVHDVTRAKALEGEARFDDAADHVTRVRELAAAASMATLSRVWQMLLKAHDETKIAPDPAAAVEMALYRIAAAAGLPPPEEAARLLSGAAAAAETQTPAAAPATPTSAPEPAARLRAVGGRDASAPAPEVDLEEDDVPQARAAPGWEPRSIADLVARAENARDLKLRSDLLGCVRPVRLKRGTLVFRPTRDAPTDLARRISAALQEWTGETWFVHADPDADGGETLKEVRAREEAEQRLDVSKDPMVAAALQLFPGAEISRIEEIAVAPDDDEESP